MKRWAFAIVAAYAVALLVQLPATGLTDDDDFYLPAGASYADWLTRLHRPETWRRPAIDAAFSPNHEHPPMAKYGLGLAGKVFSFMGPVDGPRVSTALLSTLCAALMVALAMGHLGPRRGLVVGGLASLFLLLHPRFAFHSRVATLDVPVASTYLLAAAAALWAERSARWVWGAGIAFGLAAATKLNGPFLILPMVGFWLATRWRPTGGPGGLPLPPIPATALSMAVVGPLTFFAVWPWMWFDTVPRVQAYLAFHLQHYPIYLLYFGRVYASEPFAPWHVPWVMAAATTPVLHQILFCCGVVASARPIWRRLSAGPGADDREGDLLLFALLNAAATIGVVSAFDGPKYGGVKLFLPFFPFFALLAGYGALRLLEATPRRAGPALLAAACAVHIAYPLRYRDAPLSSYGAVVGGLRGAAQLGFERQYYDVLSQEQIDWLNAHAPPRARVHFLPNNKEYVRTFRWAHREEALRKDVRVVNSPSRADLIVVTHERRFRRYDADLRGQRVKAPLYTFARDGVPLWTVYPASVDEP